MGTFVVRREVYDDVFHYSPPPQEPPSEELEQSLEELKESVVAMKLESLEDVVEAVERVLGAGPTEPFHL
jgi:hypothetical protein